MKLRKLQRLEGEVALLFLESLMGELVLGLGFFVCSFMAHAQAPEGAIVAKNYGGVYQDSVKAWSDPNAWEGGVVPGSGDVVYILNSVIVMDTDVEVAAVIIEPYGYLYLYDVNDEAILKTDGSTQYSGTGNGHTLTVTDYVKLTHNVGWTSTMWAIGTNPSKPVMSSPSSPASTSAKKTSVFVLKMISSSRRMVMWT